MNSLKNWLWIIIAVIALIIIFIAWQFGFFNKLTTPKEGAPLSSGDTTAQISRDLNTVDLGNPDQDLKQLDADLNQL